jgi:hypothetical protein
VLRFPLLPNIDGLFLNTFIADKSGTRRAAEGFYAVAAAIFDKIRPDAM